MTNTNPTKAFNIAKTIIFIVLIVGMTEMFFDEDPTNDFIGYLLLMVFWIVIFLNSLIMSLKNGDKKSAWHYFFIIVFCFSSLVYYSMKHFF